MCIDYSLLRWAIFLSIVYAIVMYILLLLIVVVCMGLGMSAWARYELACRDRVVVQPVVREVVCRDWSQC